MVPDFQDERKLKEELQVDSAPSKMVEEEEEEDLETDSAPVTKGNLEIDSAPFGKRTSHTFNENQPMHRNRNFLKVKFNENS